jgi:hypothetical protein
MAKLTSDYQRYVYRGVSPVCTSRRQVELEEPRIAL